MIGVRGFRAIFATLICIVASNVPTAIGRPVVYKKHVKDMSYNYNNETIYWPTGQVAKFTLDLRIQNLSGTNILYATGDMISGEHGGTHMDAPIHFYPQGGLTIDQIGLDRLQTEAVILNVKDKVDKDPNYQATLEDFKLWEDKHGRMPDDSMFLLCTGWEKNYPNKTKVYGTEEITNIFTMNFPGMHPDLVTWLIKNRKLNGVGMDTPSPDGAAVIAQLPIHLMTAKENILILENVKGVCDIPEHGAVLLMFPMKIEGGTGAPTRIIGTWGDQAEDEHGGGKPCTSAGSTTGPFVGLVVLATALQMATTYKKA